MTGLNNGGEKCIKTAFRAILSLFHACYIHVFGPSFSSSAFPIPSAPQVDEATECGAL